MKIRIRYFASLREITGLGEEALYLLEGTRVKVAREKLIERYPHLEPIMQRCISAVNQHYVDAETILQENDELVFIPPMGGGSLHAQKCPNLPRKRA